MASTCMHAVLPCSEMTPDTHRLPPHPCTWTSLDSATLSEHIIFGNQQHFQANKHLVVQFLAAEQQENTLSNGCRPAVAGAAVTAIRNQ